MLKLLENNNKKINFMEDFCNIDFAELKSWLEKSREKEFHAKQIFEWVYGKNVTSFDEMTNLSKSLREKLSVSFRFPTLKLVKTTESKDHETIKFLWELIDGSFVESVLIFSGDRRTVCVSSQVGCPARCAFCASGRQGFLRNLHTGEILEQVLHINRWLSTRGERVCHIVFMGMGEPLKNYEAVLRAIYGLIDPLRFNISQRRITISTVGIIEGIKRLSEQDLKVNLVLSLHAPNQHIRQKIIPYARKYPLEELMQAMDEYAEKTKRDITYEYTLIEGINDHPDHAFELANMLKGRQCTVNLIPLNPIPGIRLNRPNKKSIKEFRSVLFGARIQNTCRYTKGEDIAAACGQLALQKNSEIIQIG